MAEPAGAERREAYLGNNDYGKENRKDYRGIDPAVLGRRKRKMKVIQIALFVLGCGLELISIMEDA